MEQMNEGASGGILPLPYVKTSVPVPCLAEPLLRTQGLDRPEALFYRQWSLCREEYRRPSIYHCAPPVVAADVSPHELVCPILSFLGGSMLSFLRESTR